MRLQPVMNWSSQIQLLRPVYLHLIFIGWVTQIIMGVGYWMFPKLSREKPRGNERVGWSEHTSSKSAILQIIEGEASLTLGEDAHKAYKGAWIHMQPNLKHSVYAETPVKMILLMFDKA